VRVEIWQEGDLSGDFQVSANGTVIFPLLGERQVQGIPAERLEQELTRDYRQFLENPSVSVRVLKRIGISGEVRTPNLYMVDATVTLRDALAMAGGILPTGNPKDIRLLRDGEVLVADLDLNRFIGDMPIQSGDHIEVGPESWVSRNRYILTAGLGAFTSILAAVIVSR
jgi:polysaccharide export outer membrane protein